MMMRAAVAFAIVATLGGAACDPADKTEPTSKPAAVTTTPPVEEKREPTPTPERDTPTDVVPAAADSGAPADPPAASAQPSADSPAGN